MQERNNDKINLNSIDSMAKLYEILIESDEIDRQALLILKLRSWLTNLCAFDPVTGEALDKGIIDLITEMKSTVQEHDDEVEIKDYLYRIVIHTNTSINAIIESVRETLLREHSMVPIYAMSELDSTSIQWLSRQPGRNLREKLAGKPYIKGVQRRLSVDNSENRLLKVFLIRFEELLQLRKDAIGVVKDDICDKLQDSIQQWLRSEDAHEIGTWQNLPPNNTLLEDKHYRTIWDAWIWIQNLDEIIVEDIHQISRNVLSVILWETMSLLNKTGQFCLVQQPLNIDYDHFTISPFMIVEGLFFERKERMKSIIKSVNHDKGYGFIKMDYHGDLFFHFTDLEASVDFPSLKTGDTVSYELGSNNKGVCAVKIDMVEPEVIRMFQTDEEIKIMSAKREVTVCVKEGKIILNVAPSETRTEFSFNWEVLHEVLFEIISVFVPDPLALFIYQEREIQHKNVDEFSICLSSLRPEIIDHNGSRETLPFKLLRQEWSPHGEEKIGLDLSEVKAMAINARIRTISMKTLFTTDISLSDAVRSSNSMYFIRKLHDYISSERLQYLVPDWVNDFDMEWIRKSINFYYKKSTPVPRSIASIFAWQSSDQYNQAGIREDDIILVLDSLDGGISVTPVQAVYSKKIHDLLPYSEGILWERHPTTIIPTKPLSSSILDYPDHNIILEIEKLFNTDNLGNKNESLSLLVEEIWANQLHYEKVIRTHKEDQNVISDGVLRNSLEALFGQIHGIKVFVLPLNRTIRKASAESEFRWLGSSWSPIEGSVVLSQWKKASGEIALWRDHLPELSIKIVENGYYKDFYLVKDTTITPQLGRKVSIPVEKQFTLSAGQKQYRFLLHQGKGKHELHFEAYLNSTYFPLKEDLTCRLNMTFTYGADDPYELKFIPVNPERKLFKSIRAEWRSVTATNNIIIDSIPVPVYPAKKSWEEFQNFADKYGREHNLLDKIAGFMKYLEDLDLFFNASDQSNIKYETNLKDSWEWRTDRNGKHYMNREFDYGKVFFPENNFDVFNTNFNDISFDLQKKTDWDGYIARNISPGKPNGRYFKKSRFYVFTVWNDVHTLAEYDVPDAFRYTVHKGINHACTIMEMENSSEVLRDEIFLFLCSLHRDAPSSAIRRLLEIVSDSELLVRYKRNIAHAIGNGEQLWQKQLLNKVIQYMDEDKKYHSVMMEILATSLWRSEALAHKLDEKDVIALISSLYECLVIDIQEVRKDAVYSNIQVLSRHLELLLAILRTRNSDSKIVKKLLLPGNDITRKYIKIIDDISEYLISQSLEVVTYISLELEKPENFQKTPDLLYALRLYLSGDSGANTIAIATINHES